VDLQIDKLKKVDFQIAERKNVDFQIAERKKSQLPHCQKKKYRPLNRQYCQKRHLVNCRIREMSHG
jgi:hypothetical protein